MRPEWLWDKNISEKEARKILKDPRNERFVPTAAALLSRTNTPRENFEKYLDKEAFVRNWARIKRRMRTDAWNDPRIIFWQAVYDKLGEEFAAKGIALRPAKEEAPVDELTRQIAEKIKSCRRSLKLSQGELAEKIGISQQVISRVEKGRNDIRLLTLERIARALGRTVSVELR